MVYGSSKLVQLWRGGGECVLCGAWSAGGLDLCGGCRADLPVMGAACPDCGIPLPAAASCGRCLQGAPPFASVVSAFRYEPPVDAMIRRLKYDGRLLYGRLLGTLMAEAIAARSVVPPEVIVPVPLHPRRLRGRGYNQALELARPIAARFGAPLDLRSCRRVRETAEQSALAAAARRANVAGAFAAEGRLAGRRIAVVDDVMTTGHTLEALAEALGRAGARAVDVWVCARAV